MLFFSGRTNQFPDTIPTCIRLIILFTLQHIRTSTVTSTGTFPECCYNMAIINAIGIGRARGSMGNVTYRTVRGRTISSLKRGGVDPATRADGDTLTQFVFGLMARYASARAADIENSFSKTKYGSARNAFMKLNYEGFKNALESLYQVGMKASMITDAQIDEAVHSYATANPMVIVRAKIDGEPTVYLSGVWESNLSFGTISMASVNSITLADGLVIQKDSVSNGKVLRATLEGFEEVNLVGDGMFIELTKSGDTSDTIIQVNNAEVNQSGENFIVSGALTSAIDSGTYTNFRVCVRHKEGIGGLSNKVFTNIQVSGSPL